MSFHSLWGAVLKRRLQLILKKEVFPVHAFVEVTTKQIALVRVTPITRYLFLTLDYRDPKPIVDDLDWNKLLSYDKATVIDWSKVVEGAKTGRLLIEQDILLKGITRLEAPPWEPLPEKRIWGSFVLWVRKIKEKIK